MDKEKNSLSKEDILSLKTNEDLIKVCKNKKISLKKHKKRKVYDEELKKLQSELVNLQNWVVANNKRVAIIFEGRDAAGKGGSIKRFIEHLNPRAMRVVALSKPTDEERGQWYFRRYVKELPNAGEIVFFDRSWYNRAVVEPVMGFCTPAQYKNFMVQVTEFEHMLYETGVIIIKFWFSISKEEQKKRFNARLENPLKIWKFSPVDMQGQKLWDKYTFYKEEMFSRTHTTFSPWVIVKTNNKKRARLESIRYVLSQLNYDDKEKAKASLRTDPNVIQRYFRQIEQLDI